MSWSETLGRFKWRYSYGQSLFTHTGRNQNCHGIARMVGADVNTVRLGCLFHDIGKVFTGEQEGSHVQLGVDYLKKFNIDQKLLTVLVSTTKINLFPALKVSLSTLLMRFPDRPGARHEEVEDYIKRVTEIENVASSFKGVDKSSISAGRRFVL